MSVQSVNQNLFQLLNAADKDIRDFIATLNPGDTLKGRVVDIIPGENKAIINFKGYNIISQLPQGMGVQKGDIINVEVSQINNQIMMKLIPNPAADIGKGADIPQLQGQQVSLSQIMQTLTNIKVPVNEQNIFIAQKLMDYHLPVTAQNMADINQSLIRYMDAKGIDIRALNIETLPVAKEVFVSGMIKLSAEAANAAKSAIEAAQISQPFQALETAAANTPESLKQPAQAVSLAQPSGDKTGTAIKFTNIINTLAGVSSQVRDINVAANQGGVTVTIKNASKQIMENAVYDSVKNGLISSADAKVMIAAVSTGQPAVINSANIRMTMSPNNDLEITFGSLKADMEAFITSPSTGQASENTAANALRDVFVNKLLGSQALALKAPDGINQKADIFDAVNQQAKQIITGIRDSFAELKRNVLTPGETNLPQNVKDIAAAITKLNVGITMLSEGLDKSVDKSVITQGQINNFRSEINKAADNITQLIQKTGITNNPEETMIAPKDYLKFQSVMKDFMAKSELLSVIKPRVAESQALKITAANAEFDVESTVESLTFLKSRDISTGNDKFIDTMGKYFKDDMKLNQGLEKLSNAINRFDGLKQSNALPKEDAPYIAALYNAAEAVKTAIRQVVINPEDTNLKQQVIEQQLKSFMESSGLNIENKLKDAVLKNESIVKDNNQAAARLATDIAGMKDNLKSALIKLGSVTENMDSYKLSPAHKESIRQIKDAATDILTNMNALQFINQKPAAFEMIYAQLPVFLSNKLFNGEVQVWFRKGGVKDSFEKSMPVNIVFMLNTSNLGSVKISMTIHKNDVECTVNIASEKAKQALMRGKNDFMEGLNTVNFNMKAFQILIDSEKAGSSPSSGEGYVNVGRINLQA